MRWSIWKVAIAALALLSLIGSGLYTYFVTYRPDPARFPLRGIDVSHHQGLIGWRQVAATGIAFAYIKATEGGDWRDRRFQENWTAAAEAGMPRGAYHFYSFCRSAREQAFNFLASVPADPDALPPAVDLEFGGNCARRPGATEMLAELRVYLDLVEEALGKRALLYVTREFHDAYAEVLPTANPLWVRSILRQPTFTRRQWTVWQYHNRGRLPGIVGPVDLNVFAGGLRELELFRTRGRSFGLGPYGPSRKGYARNDARVPHS
jgi:lysozyme